MNNSRNRSAGKQKRNETVELVLALAAANKRKRIYEQDHIVHNAIDSPPLQHRRRSSAETSAPYNIPQAAVAACSHILSNDRNIKQVVLEGLKV